MPRTLYHLRGGGHHISGMTTLNSTMPEGRFTAAPISMVFQVGSMPMLLLEALNASAAAKAAYEIMDEIGLHTEQCKPAAAWREINRLTGRKFKPSNSLSAASIADRKRQLTNHYSAILNSQHNQQQQQQYRLLYSQQWQQRNSNQESAPLNTTKIRAALRMSRNYTSPSLDDIPNCVLKIPELEGEVTDMLNRQSKALNIETQFQTIGGKA